MLSESRFLRLTLATLMTSVLVFAASLTPAYASSCNINTMPDWDGNITNGWLAQAQTFQAPSGSCNVLDSYEFELAGRSTAGQFTFNVYQWGNSGPIGSALYTTTMAWGTTASLYDITGINLTLTVGQLYGFDVDFQGYNGQSIYFNGNQTGYPGFAAWWWNPAFGGWNQFSGYNTYFQANFSGTTVPEPGSMLLLGSGVIGVAGLLRRKIRL